VIRMALMMINVFTIWLVLFEAYQGR